MTKFTRSERLAAAVAVEAGDSIASVARQFGMSKKVVARSVNLYREEGKAGFHKKREASYTAAQKLVVLETMHSQGMSLEEAAVKFEILGSATIWQWERRYMDNRMDGL